MCLCNTNNVVLIKLVKMSESNHYISFGINTIICDNMIYPPILLFLMISD